MPGHPHPPGPSRRTTPRSRARAPEAGQRTHRPEGAATRTTGARGQAAQWARRGAAGRTTRTTDRARARASARTATASARASARGALPWWALLTGCTGAASRRGPFLRTMAYPLHFEVTCSMSGVRRSVREQHVDEVDCGYPALGGDAL